MTWQKEERRKLNWDHRWMTERAKREGTQTALQQDPLQYFWVRNINRSIDWSVSLLLFLCAYIFSSVSVTACVFLASIFFVPSILGLYMPTYIRLRDRFCLCPLASSFSASAYLLNGLCIFLLVFLCIYVTLPLSFPHLQFLCIPGSVSPLSDALSTIPAAATRSADGGAFKVDRLPN